MIGHCLSCQKRQQKRDAIGCATKLVRLITCPQYALPCFGFKLSVVVAARQSMTQRLIYLRSHTMKRPCGVFYNIPDECRKNYTAYRNTSQVVKLKLRLLQHTSIVLQSWYNVTTDATYKLRRATREVYRATKIVILVFQLVARHHLKACDIPT